MPYFFSPFLALCLFCFAGTLSSYGDEVGKVPTQVQSLFGTYCIECHRDGADASEFRLDASLTGDFSSLGTRARWGEIVNVLNSHEMPPEDEPQPPTDMVSGVVDWITAQLVAAERELRENRVVMRRLNRNEYRNSVRDLTGVEPDISGFPQDPLASGFDNVGAALTFSPTQLELYLDTAKQVMQKALVEGSPPQRSVGDLKSTLETPTPTAFKSMASAPLSTGARIQSWRGLRCCITSLGTRSSMFAISP